MPSLLRRDPIVTNHVLSPQVALQFPDELLCDSVPIYHSLKRAVGTNTELYVLADTSYGRYSGLVSSSTCIA